MTAHPNRDPDLFVTHGVHDAEVANPPTTTAVNRESLDAIMADPTGIGDEAAVVGRLVASKPIMERGNRAILEGYELTVFVTREEAQRGGRVGLTVNAMCRIVPGG